MNITSKQARVRVWERVEATVTNDIAVGDWVDDEDGDEFDRRRLLKACASVAKSIRLKVAKMKRSSK